MRRLTVPFLQTALRLLDVDSTDDEHPLNSHLAGRQDKSDKNDLKKKSPD